MLDLLRQVFGQEGFFPAHDHGVLDGVLQLPDIAGPGILIQQLARFRRDGREALVFRMAVDEVLRQLDDVLGSFP